MSFIYNGKKITEFFPNWQKNISREEFHNKNITHITYLDPDTHLQVSIHVCKFNDFNALDLLVEFENRGQSNTPIIEEILPLDVSIPVNLEHRVLLHHTNGSVCKIDDFLPLITELYLNNEKKLSPVGGRSSNGAFPFMNLQFKGQKEGLVLGIGWSGQWKVRTLRTQDAVHLAAGMERTKLQLHKGEKIRTPRILLLYWEGDDQEKGNNLLRQLLLAHYVPRIDNKIVMPPVAQCLQAYFYLTGKAAEQLEMTALPRAAKTGAEVYWIDACWYGGKGDWWQEVGSWVVNKKKFPNGLKPISDAAHKRGMKFLLWFEPERVRVNSLIHQEHPEWLLTNEADKDNLLFNLGIPEARQYITDLISNIIKENGIDIYRQDFNFDPLLYWQNADSPDRIGMTEIRYIEGLYAMWDELRQCHPGLWIDNCASGGRRIDLETLSRSLPLWASDFFDTFGLPFGQGLHVGSQCINAGLARWVPLFGGGVWNFSSYSIRSQIIGGFTFGFHIKHKDFPDDDTGQWVNFKEVLSKGRTLLDKDFPLKIVKRAIEEWKSIRQFFLGDFYLLLPLTVSYYDWCAWQFHRKDLNAGIAVFLRRHKSPFLTMQIQLKQIKPHNQYKVSLSSDYEKVIQKKMSGKELLALSVTIREKPGSILLRYTKVK